MKILGAGLILSLFLFSYLLRLFERHVDHKHGDFNHITTAMWNIVITMTTVGYGDIYPKSHMGRFIGILTAFWGVFFSALFVVALSNILTFKPPEAKAFILLRRL